MQKPTLSDTLKLSATYAGTLIGAGFASGQEILRFFTAYGTMGIVGLFLAGCLFAWLGYTIMKVSRRIRASGYHQLLYFVLGSRTGFFFDILFAVLLFGVFTVMLAGSGAVCEVYDLPYLAGLIGMGVAAFATVARGIRGITKVNSFTTPLLALATISVGMYSLFYHGGLEALPAAIPPQPALAAAPHWLLGCLLYVSYNLVIGSTVLVPLGAAIHSKSSRLWGSCLAGVLLFLLSLFVVMALILHYPSILMAEVPMLEISGMQHVSIYSLYSFILLAAMYTTSIACLYGCAVQLQSACGIPFFVCNCILVLLGIAASHTGFSRLISLIFPLFGSFGLYFTIKLIWRDFRGN